MGVELLAAVIFVVGAAIPCMVFGYLIAVKQKRTLINSWNDENCTNPRLAAQIIGFNLVLTGMIIACAVIAGATGVLTLSGVGICFGVAVVLPLLANFYAEMKFFHHR